jgi:DNA-directed RNA polymerase specialized sigma24 family protein
MIVVLYEMEGKSLEEIAQIVKKPLGTVKSRLFHGRKALEKHLRGFNLP